MVAGQVRRTASEKESQERGTATKRTTGASRDQKLVYSPGRHCVERFNESDGVLTGRKLIRAEGQRMKAVNLVADFLNEAKMAPVEKDLHFIRHVHVERSEIQQRVAAIGCE